MNKYDPLITVIFFSSYDFYVKIVSKIFLAELLQCWNSVQQPSEKAFLHFQGDAVGQLRRQTGADEQRQPTFAYSWGPNSKSGMKELPHFKGNEWTWTLHEKMSKYVILRLTGLFLKGLNQCWNGFLNYKMLIAPTPADQIPFSWLLHPLPSEWPIGTSSGLFTFYNFNKPM